MAVSSFGSLIGFSSCCWLLLSRKLLLRDNKIVCCRHSCSSIALLQIGSLLDSVEWIARGCCRLADLPSSRCWNYSLACTPVVVPLFLSSTHSCASSSVPLFRLLSYKPLSIRQTCLLLVSSVRPKFHSCLVAALLQFDVVSASSASYLINPCRRAYPFPCRGYCRCLL